MGHSLQRDSVELRRQHHRRQWERQHRTAGASHIPLAIPEEAARGEHRSLPRAAPWRPADAALYIADICGRATYKLTWEEIVALYRLTLDQPAVNTRARYNVCPTRSRAPRQIFILGECGRPRAQNKKWRTRLP
jgi:hypothetical protein